MGFNECHKLTAKKRLGPLFPLFPHFNVTLTRVKIIGSEGLIAHNSKDSGKWA